MSDINGKIATQLPNNGKLQLKNSVLSLEKGTQRRRENGIYTKCKSRKASDAMKSDHPNELEVNLEVNSKSTINQEHRTAAEWYKFLHEKIDEETLNQLISLMRSTYTEIDGDPNDKNLCLEDLKDNFIEYNADSLNYVQSRLSRQKVITQEATFSFFHKRNFTCKNNTFSIINTTIKHKDLISEETSFSLLKLIMESEVQSVHTCFTVQNATNKKLRMKNHCQDFEIFAVKSKAYEIGCTYDLTINRTSKLNLLKISNDSFLLKPCIKTYCIVSFNNFILNFRSKESYKIGTIECLDIISKVDKSNKLKIENCLSACFSPNIKSNRVSDISIYNTCNLQLEATSTGNIFEDFIRIDDKLESRCDNAKASNQALRIKPSFKSRSSRILRHVQFDTNTELRPSIIRCLTKEEKKETFISSLFMDVLCISCYNCVKVFDTEQHSNICSFQIESWSSLDLNIISKLKEIEEVSMDETLRTNLIEQVMGTKNCYDIKKLVEVRKLILEEIAPLVTKKKSKKAITALHSILSLKLEKIVGLNKIMTSQYKRCIPKSRIIQGNDCNDSRPKDLPISKIIKSNSNKKRLVSSKYFIIIVTDKYKCL